MSASASSRDADRGHAYTQVLASVLERLVASNDASGQQVEVTRFHALRAPGISIRDYLDR